MKILVYPKDSNPYQDLLYGQIRRHYGSSAKVTYCKRLPLIGAILFPFQVFVRRLEGYKLIHIHWPAFDIALPIPFRKQISFGLFILCVASLKALQYKIVWTVHNVVPHQSQTNNDLELMQYFSKIVDEKIVHSRYTIQQMKDTGLDISNCTVIPIGSYGGIYPEKISAAEAREKLTITKDEFVILFFGLIRPYKGVDDLLEAFISMNASHVRLVIAGKCIDERIRQKIMAVKNKHTISFYDYSIPDNEVGMYFQASNVVCLPFKKVTTTSTALLAMSFGKPIIAPCLGTLRDLPKNAGYLYNPNEVGALEKSLLRAVAQKSELKNMGQVAKKYTKTLSWDKIAKMTYGLYKKVMGSNV